MSSIVLRERIRIDIRSRADRILRELGYPEPPLRLEDVRLLLSLDFGYFSGESDGVMKQVFSRLKRAGKQLFSRPMLLAEAVKKFELRALYIPDQKRILIDESVPKPKHRWLEAHEIGHDLLPWHKEVLLGEDDLTPTVSVLDKMEAEANYAAGSLLFLNDRFDEECRSREFNFTSIMELKKIFGNTLTTTLWKAIECQGEELASFGLVGIHPREYSQSTIPFRHIIESPAFCEQYNFANLDDVAAKIASYCHRQRGPLGEGHLVLKAKDGRLGEFRLETFYNGYDALTLGIQERIIPVTICVPWSEVRATR